MNEEPERWVVTYTMEGKACRVVNGSLEKVAALLSREDETDFPAAEWMEDFADEDNWSRDESGELFEFYMAFGEIAAVSVTRVTFADDLVELGLLSEGAPQ